MAIQDLTTYTENDVNNHLTVTSTTATGAAVDYDEDVYLYKDFGADAIDDFDIDFTIVISASSQANGLMGVGVTNATVDELSGWQTNDAIAYAAELAAAPTHRIYLREGDLSEGDYVSVTASTVYYCTLYRVAGNATVSLDVFDDAARSSQIGVTKTITIAAATKFRYFYAAVNYFGGAGGSDFYGYISDITLIASGVSSGFIPKVSIF